MEEEVMEVSGVENDVSAAETQTETTETPAPDQEKNNNFEKAFAKRLAAKESEWKSAKESEMQKMRDEFKDFDTYKKAAEYLQKTSGIQDMMSLREEIELQELQERADRENVSPEIQKRIEQLEAKAAKADELEAQSNQEKAAAEFETSLKTFAEGKEIDGKPVDHKELWQYMHENEISKPDVALKAMKADILEAKLATVKEDSIKEYLNSKKGVKTDGLPGTAAQSIPQTGGGLQGAEARAIARIQAARSSQ